MNFFHGAAVVRDDRLHPVEIAHQERAHGLRVRGFTEPRGINNVAEDKADYLAPLGAPRVARQRLATPQAKPRVRGVLLATSGTMSHPSRFYGLALTDERCADTGSDGPHS